MFAGKTNDTESELIPGLMMFTGPDNQCVENINDVSVRITLLWC